MKEIEIKLKEKRKAARESKKLQKGRQCKKQISEALSESEDSNDKFQFADTDNSFAKLVSEVKD